MATLMLRIDGLDADAAARLERLLLDLPGVFGAVVGAAAGCAEVDFEDDEGDLDELLDRLRDAGFDVHLSG